MTTRVTLRLPGDLVAAARRAVASGHAPTLSAYVADALSAHLSRQDASDVVAQLLEEVGGPASPQERARAEALLGWR